MEERLLLVDDEIGILLAFKKLLQSPELAVDTAQTIEEAEELLKTRTYKVVVADLRLTGVLGEEGLEIIKYVREHSIRSHVILVTGYGNPEVEAKAYQLGADFYFEKPVKAELLRDTIRSLGVRA